VAYPEGQAGSQELAVETTPKKRAKTDSPPPADAFYRTVQVSTIQGMEDVLNTKQKAGFPSSCQFHLDELSQLLMEIAKNPGLDSSYNSLFNGIPIRANTRTTGMVNIPAPRVNIIGFTQPTSLLKALDRMELDTGGLFERFLFVCPTVPIRSMHEVAEIDVDGVLPFEKALKLAISFFEKEPRNFVFTDEAKKLLYDTADKLKEEAADCQDSNSDFLNGLNSKAYTKLIRLSAVLSATKAVYQCMASSDHSGNLTASPTQSENLTTSPTHSGSLTTTPTPANEDIRTQMLTDSLNIREDSVRMALSHVEYSNQLALIMKDYLRQLGGKGGVARTSTSWFADPSNLNLPVSKLFNFVDQIRNIYMDTEKIHTCQVLVRDVIKNTKMFPNCSANVKKGTTDAERCLYFLQVLEKHGLWDLSEDKKILTLRKKSDTLSNSAQDLIKAVKSKHETMTLI